MTTTTCDIVAFAAHPDDVELACGGTLVLAARQGWRTAVVDCTRGELSTRGTPEKRAREADAASQALGLSCRLNLGLPDGHLHDSDETRREVVQVLRRLRPRVVLAPPAVDHHADHMAVAQIVSRSFYLAGVEKYVPGEPPWRPHTLLHHLGSLADTPSLVVDITSTYADRVAAIECYQSQFHKEDASERETRISHRNFLAAVEGTARHFGALIGVEFGEAFTVQGPVPVQDLVSLFAGEPWK